MIEVLDQSTCTECGVCLLVCPMDVIARDRRGGYVVRHVEDCMSCFACEMECRPGSIRVGPSRRAKPSLLRAWTRRSTLEGSPPARANQLRG